MNMQLSPDFSPPFLKTTLMIYVNSFSLAFVGGLRRIFFERGKGDVLCRTGVNKP